MRRVTKELLRGTSFASLSILFLTVCTPAQTVNTPTPTRMGNGSIQASVMATAPARPEDGKAGSPESDPSGMADYVLSVPFGEGVSPSDVIDQELPCEPNASACGGAATVRIRIVPSNFAPGVDWNDVLNPPAGRSPNGHVVAKFTNMSDNRFAPLNLPAHESAYLWIGQAGNSNQRKAVVYKITSRAATPIKQVRDYKICQKPRTGPAVHLYPMFDCNQGAASTASNQPIAKLASLFTHESRTPMLHGSGLWVSCSAGCCQVTMVQ
ncbi:MAG TPA: hypothetical protein VM099_00765 [Gemmatimonadaceae bacterium]|nr:hypothetical protein [Gemmatimonadaceae bacterium]